MRPRADGTSASASADRRTPVSVIVVNWNGRAFLEPLIAALLAQTHPPDQIIVVDNGSTDGSLELLERRTDIVLVPLLENLGFAGGNNAGLHHATGEFVALLNNDALPSPTWLQELARVATARSDVGIVASLITDWSGDRIDAAGDACTYGGRGYKRYHGAPVERAPESGPVFSACAAAALYRKAMIDEIGFFEPDFVLNAEDTDLSYRAQLAGWSVTYLKTAVVRHRISASLGVHSARSVRFSGRNHLWLWLRNTPIELVPLLLPALIAQQCILLVFFLTRGRAREFLSAHVEALSHLRRVLQQRARIQRTRRVGAASILERLSPISAYVASALGRNDR